MFKSSGMTNARVARHTHVLPVLLLLVTGEALAADAQPDRRGEASSIPRFKAEVFASHLASAARELVYNVPDDGSKLSQLNWQIDNAAVLGGALSYAPFDWLTLRTRAWTHVSSDNAMDDFDWLFGYNGFESWSDLSRHGDTRLAKAFQIDVGASAGIFEIGQVRFNALLGYRFQTMKWNAFGGSFIYSTDGFRDDIGSFPAGELEISYQQWWHTPYLGLGVSYVSGPLSLTIEAIGSPFVSARDRDNHVDIALFKEAFHRSAMIGGSVSAELALSQRISVVARAEADHFFQARGGIKEFDVDPPVYSRFPKPAAGVDLRSVLVSVGAKARF
jgi:plasminogen activator